MDLDDIRLYLPKYLSPETERKLFRDLEMFPDNIDDRMFADLVETNIYQGDAIRNVPVLLLPNRETKYVPCLILSNTCDIEMENQRLFRSGVVYAPIISLSTYIAMLSSEGIEESRIESHLRDIRRQRITQVFYVPRSASLEESIVFFDRLVSNDVEQLGRPTDGIRLFSLSQYGHYMLLYKMSMHFTRIVEGFDRKY